jgi:hypothetical protein
MKIDMQKELKTFFESETGENLIGQIMLNVVNVALTREVTIEDGKSKPGRTIEKTERRNVLDMIAEYLPGVEGAIRGCQADSAKARNRATEVRDVLLSFKGLVQDRTDLKLIRSQK